MELTQLEGIGKSTARLLEEAGVFSLEQLAGLEAGFTVPGISTDRLAGLQDKALELICPDVEEAPFSAGLEVEDEVPDDVHGGSDEQPEDPMGKQETQEPAELEEAPIEFRYKKLTFLGMVGRPDVGELEIHKFLFQVGEPQNVPEDIAEMILSRKQYLFDVEDVKGE